MQLTVIERQPFGLQIKTRPEAVQKARRVNSAGSDRGSHCTQVTAEE